MKNNFAKRREERKALYASLSNKEKIQYDGKKLLKILDVVRKILHVCAIIACVVGISFMIMGACHKAQEIQEKTGIVEMEKGQGGFPLVSVVDGDEIVLEEDTPEGWDKFFMEIGAYCVFAAVMIIVFMMIARLMKKVFSQVMNAETPFCEESKLPLRKIFILLTIVIFCKEQFLGVVCGFVFLYLYRLFAYGCELQVESDETL